MLMPPLPYAPANQPKKPSRMVFASDSFKGTLSSARIAQLLEEAAHKSIHGVQCTSVPMADGGEGTVQAIVTGAGGMYSEAHAHGPLGDEVVAQFGLLDDGRRAVLEMAAASGLTLIASEQRNPLLANSYGTGELIIAALDAGAEELLIGLGGSATNDGGMGMLRALGVRFFDSADRELAGCGADLEHVARIDDSGLDPRLAECHALVMCDVDNPLTGSNGATQVFGPQKGASPADLKRLEAGMGNYARMLESRFGAGCCDVAGAGAAGGMGAALMTFLSAELAPGVECVLDAVGFDGLLQGADLCVTGEGRLDAQTLHGKTVVGVAARCKAQGVPCLALVGSVDASIDLDALGELGVTRVEDIASHRLPWEEAAADPEGEYLNFASGLFTMMYNLNY